MPRYQLRIPKQENLETVLDGIVEKAWSSIEPHLNPRALQPEDHDDFRSAVRSGLASYICAYDLCGSAPECSDEIEGAPYLDREDSIKHLVVPESFSDLVYGLAYSAFYSIRGVTKKQEEAFVLAALEVAFRQRLSQNLFYNPICGKIDLCNRSREIDPWKEL